MVRNGNVKGSIFEGEACGEASGSLWKDKHGNATLNGVIGFGVEGGNALGIFARPTIDHDVSTKKHGLSHPRQIQDTLFGNPFEPTRQKINRSRIRLTGMIGNIDGCGCIRISSRGRGRQMIRAPNDDGSHKHAHTQASTQGLDPTMGLHFDIFLPQQLGCNQERPKERRLHPNHIEPIHPDMTPHGQGVGRRRPNTPLLIHSRQRHHKRQRRIHPQRLAHPPQHHPPILSQPPHHDVFFLLYNNTIRTTERTL
mmetsp:Transcript_17332/g.31294  ORF Transcript_17332/g.31294 Transcript_17332/m.31294 type:complete len:254 (-) Transcript_17332:160-921(-)